MADSASDDDDDEPGPSVKRPKLTKVKGAAVYKTKFSKDWSKKWPFICEVQGKPYLFECTICKRQVGCEHQGQHDVERHITTEMHKRNAKAARTQTNLGFLPVSNPLMDKVTVLSCIIGMFTVEMRAVKGLVYCILLTNILQNIFILVYRWYVLKLKLHPCS